MSTISTTITTAVTLTATSSYSSPLTITATGEVENGNTLAAIDAAVSNAVITNSGQIIDADGAGIYIKKSGTVTNLGTAALISGGGYGIYSGTTKPSTIINQGTIRATLITGTGIYLPDGGFVSNTGAITGGAYGIYIKGTAAGTITNQGSITATRAAGYGIYLQGGGTIANAGTIAGGKDAILFGSANTDFLVDDPRCCVYG